MLTFNDYQLAAKATAVYPDKHAIVYPALGLSGEAGEVSEKVKKWLRGDRDLDRAAVAKELGDVLWYLSALATDLGFTLEEVAQINVNKLLDRQSKGTIKGDGDNR
jgi:NTP pyrophosphatase (non-canonical NTP hydrolase)